MSLTAPAQGAISHDAGTANRAVSAQSGQGPLTPALAQQLSRNVTDKVIIVLRNQINGLPDTPANSGRRKADVMAIQRGVMSELTATHARNVRSISLVNAVAATVSPGEAKRLAHNTAVAEVISDLPIPVLPSLPKTIKPNKPAPGATPVPGECPAKKTGVQLNPEAITNIHAASQTSKSTAQGLGYTGAGVKVAWIADGIDINNPDFIRANGQHVFVDYQDFSGTGTSANTSGGEAFLDASSIAAQGRHVYNIQNFGNVPLNRPCLIRVLGVAPGASLVGLNVFGSSNVAFNSVFLEAIDWAVTHDHVNVLNESFGSNPFPDLASLDLTKQADEAAVKAGVTVVASSGDAGVTNTIGSPATDPAVISAGASTTFRSYAQSDAFGYFGLGLTGWIDNNISAISSSGFDQAGGTVDVVAPGDLNWTLCTPTAQFAACTDFAGNPAPVQLSGGTSEASPLTAGTAALVIQAYRKGHGGRSPSPAVVKRIILSTAQDISAPADQQGAGLVDAYQAVLAARSYPGVGRTQSRKGHAILDSATQINAVGATSHAEHLTEKITNDGSGKVTVKVSSRTLSAPATRVSKTLSLMKSQFYQAAVSIHVPKGQARLNVSVTIPNGVLLLGVISPTGQLAGNNFPQGSAQFPGDYGNAQVANPAPGTWTAVVEGIPSSGSPPATIKAPFSATTSTFTSFGSVSKHVITLAPGASSSFKLNVSTPAKPGDRSGAIVLHAAASEPGFAAQTTIPVTLRSLVPVPAPATAFTGTLTGGNGRSPSTGQTAYYQIRLPAGERALNASVSTSNPNNTLFAVLVDPKGQAVSAAQNGLQKSGLVLEKGAQLHVLKPVAGVWTLVVDFYSNVSGTAVSQLFNVHMNVTPVKASVTGLPDSVHAKLKSGKAVTARIRVTNSGTVPEEYFVDARLATQAVLTLAPQTVSSLTLPNLTGVVPTFLVPSLTTAIAAQVTAPQPNIFDLNWAFGDPDLASNIAKTSSVKLVANDIPNGDWTVTPFLQGPDGATGPSPVTATVAMTAKTSALDPTITASSGDLWDQSTNPSAALAPIVVNPGQTVTIPVKITPSGSSGQVVSGTVYLSAVSFNPTPLTINFLPIAAPTASTVASFPYTYTIR